jgi:hypothetical protein
MFRNASSIHKNRSHLSSIKARPKPNEEIIIPGESQGPENNDSIKRNLESLNLNKGAPSFMEKREL